MHRMSVSQASQTVRVEPIGDRDLLIEAVANLVDNAVKFTPAGGQVEIGLFRGNGENIVRVRDTGSGITEHERDAVLRRFYRSDKVRHTSGLGLGLNLVAAIVKLHSFRVTIRPGSGCVVEIACPYAPTSTEPAKINSARHRGTCQSAHPRFVGSFRQAKGLAV